MRSKIAGYTPDVEAEQWQQAEERRRVYADYLALIKAGKWAEAEALRLQRMEGKKEN